MSIFDRLRRKSLTASPAVISALQGGSWVPGTSLGGTNVQAIIERWAQAQSSTYGFMYRNQPAVRKVVHKIADNFSQMCPKYYERVSDTERQSANDDPAALTLRYPNPQTPADRFIYDVVSDFLIYDNSYVFMTDRGKEFAADIYRWPVKDVTVVGAGIVTTGYRLYLPDGSFTDRDVAEVMHWRGYNPDDPRIGVPPLETLRLILAEDAALQSALTELSKSGLKGGHLERDGDAPEIDRETAQRIVESWAAATKASPRLTPLLEEGMKYVDDGVTPKDAQAQEARQFTTDEVCDVYGVPRGMFSDNITEEDRDAFYSDVIAPLSKKLASVLDHYIAQGIYGQTDHYFAFDLNEKMRGSPEVRFPAYTQAAGRAWQTVNEIRSLEDLPPVEGGDELAIQANVMLVDEYGNAINPNPNTPQLPAPNVMPPQDPNGNPADGSYRENPKALTNGHSKAMQLLPRRVAIERRRSEDAGEFESIYRRHFSRQQKVLSSKQVGSATDERWNTELGHDLFKQYKTTVAREGGIAAARMAGEFDPGHTVNYLSAKAHDSAVKINRKTADDIASLGAQDAFTAAKDVRAPLEGITEATGLFAWSTKEAITQTGTENRSVSVSGGDCEVCAPYQGEWRVAELDSWPPYHANCNCIAEAA